MDIIDIVNSVVGKRARNLPHYIDVEELRSIGYETAIKAEREWQPVRNVPIEAYVGMKVKYALMDALRTREYLKGVTVTPWEDMSLLSPATEDPDSTTTVAIRSALASLTPYQREVVFRVYWQGENTVEIAASRGVTQSAITMVLRDARKRLAATLGITPKVSTRETCRNGHTRTEENTHIKRNGDRSCRLCERETERVRRYASKVG